MSKARAKATPTVRKPRTYAIGGGNATASGVNFQQSLGAVIAAWMLTEGTIDQRLRLGSTKVVGMRMETEAPLDDVLAETSDGGFVSMQAKTNLSSSAYLASEFGKTVDQIVRQWRLCRDGNGDKGWNRPLDPAKDRLVIVVGPDSPATIRKHLARGLEARRQIGPAVLTKSERKALNDFDTCIRLSWAAATTDPLTDFTMDALSKLTFVYTIDPAGTDRTAITTTLGPAAADPADAASVLNLLERMSGDLMSTRGGVDVPGLRRDLIGRGAKLNSRPDFRTDIGALRTYSLQIEQTLRAYEIVEAEAGRPIGIERHCQSAVYSAALAGNLILIGEPGAGKSAVINALGRNLRSQGHDVIELAVDRFSVESLEGLSNALGLHHNLLDVLKAWDGPGPAFVLLDALDAGRGGSAETVFKRLIEAVIELGGRWTVLASIRTFDLRLGHNFRALFKGTPPDLALRSADFPVVRHIQVPPWSDQEFDELLGLSPRLAEVLRGSPAKLRELAMVPFNTRLLADLVAAGAVSRDFRAVDSQLALLDLYWERRVEHHGSAAEVCLRTVVAEMVERRTLRAPRLTVAAQNPNILDALVGEGVLVSTDQQRSVQFRHHLLFDYVANRVFLDASGIVAGQSAFPKADGLGLVLAPAMSFLLRGLWIEDTQHSNFWSAVSQLLGGQDCDPVIRGIAARMAAELPVVADDISPFTQMIGRHDSSALRALPHIVSAIAVRLEDEPVTAFAPWVKLALELSKNPTPAAGPLRLLSFLLVDRVKDDALRRDLGTAVRALLQYGFTLDDSRIIATPTIGFVADTISTDCSASIALLSQIFQEKRFERFGYEEVPALARKIATVAKAAPNFAADIYRGVYTRDFPDKQITSMGSGRVLNLTSNTQQDFELARWSLGEYFATFLAESPVEATQAFLDAMEGYVARRHPIPESATAINIDCPEGRLILQPDLSHIWAHDVHPQHAEDGEALLSKFALFLESGVEAAALTAAQVAVKNARLSAVWSRLFMAAAERDGALARLALPFAARIEFLVAPDTRKDAIDLVAVYYDQFTEMEREALEQAAVHASFDAFTYPEEAKTGFLRRLFGAIGSSRLATDAARTVLDEHPPGNDVNHRLFKVTTETIEPAIGCWMDQETRSDPATVRMFALIDSVKAKLYLGPGNNEEPSDLDAAMVAITALRGAIDANAVTDQTLKSRAEGTFAQAVHKLGTSALILETTAPHTVDIILHWIESGAASRYPEVDAETEANFERSSAWGSPCARLEAAEAALDLVLKRPETYSRLQPLVDRMLSDPHPAVRMNAALHLVRIWDLDRHGFWTRAFGLVANEQNRAVLDTFITRTLSMLVWHGGARQIADMVLPLLDRFTEDDPRNKSIRHHLVQMTVQLWLHFDFADAIAKVNSWVTASVDHATEVRDAIIWLRGAYTAGLRGIGDTQPADHRGRAIGLIAAAVEQAAQDLAGYGDSTVLSDAEATRAKSAIQLIDTACQQIYFSSGAFKDQNNSDAQQPVGTEGLRVLFEEIAPTLRRIAEHGGPHTIYYLIQLLEYLIETDPARAFDLIALAVQRGGRNGYQFDSLAADLMAKLVGRYLADHKEIFDDPQRRGALVETLEIFVAAGWPAVRRLLYRLPELLH